MADVTAVEMLRRVSRQYQPMTDALHALAKEHADAPVWLVMFAFVSLETVDKHGHERAGAILRQNAEAIETNAVVQHDNEV